MPNGGDVPCCGVCQYASKLADSSGIVCSKHDIRVTRDGSMFCADLSHPHYPGLSHFVAPAAFKKGSCICGQGYIAIKNSPLLLLRRLPLGLKKNEASIFVPNGKSGKMNIALNMATIGSRHYLPA